MKKVDDKKFIPFAHEHLELKNQLIEYARDLAKRQDFESRLASAVIYASFAEYLSDHLLNNLRYFTYQSTYQFFGALLFAGDKGETKARLMGDKIKCLETYTFPDKEEILKLFKQISGARNDIFHNFAVADEGDLVNIGSEITLIQEKTELLLIKINTIYSTLQKILLPQSLPSQQSQQNQDGTTP